MNKHLLQPQILETTDMKHLKKKQPPSTVFYLPSSLFSRFPFSVDRSLFLVLHPFPRFYPEVRTQCAHLEVILTAQEYPVGRGMRLKMHCTLGVYVCMCALRVSCDPDSQVLLITNSGQALQMS